MRRRRIARGFSLLEGLVTSAILVVAMTGLLSMLESATRITKQETGTSDAQATGRSGIAYVTRILREARVGQLSFGGAILPFAENAADGTTITDMAGTVHTLRPGTDAVEARGSFFGETYVLGASDVSCGAAPCTLSSSAIAVTIRQQTAAGFANYPAGKLPALASKSSAFTFVVVTAATQAIPVGTSTYAMPLTVAGRVNTSPGWYSTTSTSFTFTMDATDPGARTLQATNDTTAQVLAPTTGAAVDDVLFYVDRGDEDKVLRGVYPHPYLAQAIRDVATGAWDVQPIAPEVEDFQIAYGIDGADASAKDGAVDPMRVSATAGADEWIGTAVGESLTVLSNPSRVDAFYDTTLASAPPYPLAASAALKALLVAVVVKSKDPDPTYAGPGAWGYKVLDSTALSISASVNRSYRRRVQQMAVGLRNFS